MKVVRESDHYIILDDFLDERSFGLIHEYTMMNDYARNPKWMKPWDLADTMPWQSGETVSHPTKRLDAGDPRRQYPTGTAVDNFVEKVINTKFYRQNFGTAECESVEDPQRSMTIMQEDRISPARR